MRLASAMGLFLIVSFVSAADQPDPLSDFGAEVNGLRLKIVLEKPTIASGQPVVVKCIKRNVSKNDLIVWHSGFWPNHRIIVKNPDATPATLTAAGKQRHDAFHPGGERDKNFPVTLKPDQEDLDGEVDLAASFDLSKPGNHTVEIVYEEKQTGWQGRVSSNTAVFEIK